jgi:hypothetical protein
MRSSEFGAFVGFETTSTCWKRHLRDLSFLGGWMAASASHYCCASAIKSPTSTALSTL